MAARGHSVEDYVCHPRLFVSCSAKDRESARALVLELEADSYRVEWLETFPAGASWRQTVEAGISTAYAMVVLWTPTAASSQWVQTEIGFAIGRGVPVLLAVDGGPDPLGMAGEIQHFARSQVLRRIREDLPQILSRPLDGMVPMTIATYPEERADWLARRAEEVRDPSVIRQVAVFSTFGIPLLDPEHSPSAWEARDDGSRTPGHRRKQYRERQAFEAHARGAGARLIISPRVLRRGRGPTRQRLETLRAFLLAPSSANVTVALADSIPPGNLTVLGDRFVCESRAPAFHGFAHSTFTSHVPSVLRAIREFENVFRGLVRGDEADFEASRNQAVDRIDEISRSLDP